MSTRRAGRIAGDGSVHEEPPASGILIGAMLVRMATFQRVGWLRMDLRMGEFIDWMARAREAGLRLASLPEPVLRRRIHDTNTGVRVHALRNEYAAVVKAALDRRRSSGQK